MIGDTGATYIGLFLITSAVLIAILGIRGHTRCKDSLFYRDWVITFTSFPVFLQGIIYLSLGLRGFNLPPEFVQAAMRFSVPLIAAMLIIHSINGRINRLIDKVIQWIGIKFSL